MWQVEKIFPLDVINLLLGGKLLNFAFLDFVALKVM
jgi:hypothetical protein